MPRYYFLALFFLSTLNLFSCATPIVSGPSMEVTANADEQKNEQLAREASGVIIKEIIEADAKMEAAASMETDKNKRERRNRLKVEVNEQVYKWIHYFTVKAHDRFQRFLDRGENHRQIIEKILNEEKVPLEFYYLAMIESGFVIKAHSPMGAVGVWQFMPRTGKMYGLEADYYIDERKDPIRATRAAARHLRDLKKQFKSWYLAIAAYNAGYKRVRNGIRKGKSRNYWTLVRKKVLPLETRNYVPKFLAALVIGKNPKRFGFRTPTAVLPIPVQLVKVPSPVHLKDVARLSNVSMPALKKLNPHIKRGITPPGLSSYELWVPTYKASKVANLNPWLKRLRLKHITKRTRTARRGISRSARVAARGKVHRIKRGDTLSSIARKYSVTPAQLKKVNDLDGSQIQAGDNLIVSSAAAPSKAWYRVKKGDNLDKIARKFGISIWQLKRLNSIKQSNTIFAGQSLKIL